MLNGLCVCGECLNNIGTAFSMMGNVKHSGRNKLKYVSYRCGNRDRTKECKNHELRREYIEAYVISLLQEKIFNDDAIPVINDFQKSKETNVKSEKARLNKSITGIERQIENIINAIAGGISNSSLNDKLEGLEQQSLNCPKSSLRQKR